METKLAKFKTNETLQLKINAMLNRPMQKVNLLNQQYFIEHIQSCKANVYVVIDRVKGYIWPIQLQNASKVAVMIQKNAYQVTVNRIVTQGNNKVTLYSKAKDQYLMRKSDEKELQLQHQEHVIHISDYYSFDRIYMNVLITNLGNTFLVYSNSNERSELKVQSVNLCPKGKYKIINNLAKSVASPFLMPPKQYQYCYSDLFRVAQNNRHSNNAYILLFNQLKVQMVFADYSIDYDSREKSRYEKKWELDIEECLGKANPDFKITLIWYMQMAKRVNDRAFILVGCNYMDSNRANCPALLMVQIDCFNSQLLNVNKVDLEIQADYRLAQALQFQGFVYVLVRKAHFESSQTSQDEYSALIKISVNNQNLVKEAVQILPFTCSLSTNQKYLLLLTQIQTYIIDQIKEEKILEEELNALQPNVQKDINQVSSIASQNSYDQIRRHEANQRHDLIRNATLKRIQTSLSRKNYLEITASVERKKCCLGDYIQKHKLMEESPVMNAIKDYQIELLTQQLVLFLLKNRFFQSQDIPDQVKNEQRMFTDPRAEDIQQFFAFIFQQQFMVQHDTYVYLISLIDHVLRPYSQKSQNLSIYIKQKFGPIMQETLQILQATDRIIDNKTDYEYELLKKWVQIADPTINDLRGMIHNRTTQLQQIMKSLRNQNLFILFYCETDLLDNKDLKSFIRRCSQKKDQKAMHSFIQTLLHHYLQCVRVGSFPKKDLAIFQYISPYEDFAYKFLKENYRKIAWLVGLRLGIRDSQQIGRIGVNMMQRTENVDKMLTVISDLNDQNFKGDEVMIQICKNYGWQQYVSADEFANRINQLNHQIKGKRLPVYLWQKLKQTSLSYIPQNKLSKLQANLNLLRM